MDLVNWIQSRKAKTARPRTNQDYYGPPFDTITENDRKQKNGSQIGKNYQTVKAGGPGSGCRGPNCGRPKGPGSQDTAKSTRGRLKNAEVQFLETAPVAKVEEYGGGINETDKIRFANGMKAIFKPVDQEARKIAKRWGIRKGSQGQREVTAWEVAKIVGMDDLVAPAVMRKVNGRMGPVIGWRPGATPLTMPYDKRYGSSKDTGRGAAFDYVIGNADRNPGNWFVDPAKKRIYLFDHGLAFPDAPFDARLNSLFLLRASEAYPSQVIPVWEAARPFVENRKEILQAVKKAGFSTQAVNGVSHRIDILRKARDWEDLVRQ